MLSRQPAIFSRRSLASFHLVKKRRFFAMQNMSRSGLIEEQGLPQYSQKRYYPVRIGQQLNARYKVIAKLGFGAYSTVWLVRDQKTNKYSTVKIFIQDDTSTSPVLNELSILERLQRCPRDHGGSAIARLADDFFQLDGPTGRHHCVAQKPQGCSLWTLQHMFSDGRLPKEFVANAVRCLLGCINWLYLDCDLIHTEITSQNVLTQAASDDQFVAIEREEALQPSEPTLDNGYPLYRSHAGPRSILDLTGVAYLSDFGSSRLASAVNKDWCMPDTYRAPEVLMGVPWGCQIDVWSIGIMAIELLEGRNLFDPIDKIHSQYVLPEAIAQYVSVLGPPPLWMIQESENPVIRTFFDENGRWISEVPIPKFSLDDWVTSLPIGEERKNSSNS